MRRAASRIAVSGSHTTGAARTSGPTGRSAGSAAPVSAPSAGAGAPAAGAGRSCSVRATNRTPDGPREHRRHDLRRQPVEQHVLGGLDLERHGQAGEHRRVADHLALGEQVERASAVEQLDGPAAHDPHVMRRAPAPWRRIVAPRAWNSISRRAGDRVQLGLVERVERRVVAQEVGDVVDHAAVSVAGRTPAWPGTRVRLREPVEVLRLPRGGVGERHAALLGAHVVAQHATPVAAASARSRSARPGFSSVAVDRARDLARVDELLARDLQALAAVAADEPAVVDDERQARARQRAGPLDDEEVGRRRRRSRRAAPPRSERRRDRRALTPPPRCRRGAGRRRR